MNIVVAVKQVPGATTVAIDPQTKRLVREGVTAVLNPFDLQALEMALLLRKRHGGRVLAISMGPPKAEAALRECLALGVDEAVLLSDRAFGGSDTWATSLVLATAVTALGAVDLLLCGKQAIDGDTAQVAPGIAAHLGWAQAMGVVDITVDDEQTMTVLRQQDHGQDRCRVRLPAVLGINRAPIHPRVPSLVGWLCAIEALVPTWSAEKLAIDPQVIGLRGSPTRVVRTGPPPARETRTVFLDGDATAVADTLFRALRTRSVW